MDKIWRLLTSVFIRAASGGLFILGWILSGGRFNNILSALIGWVVLIMIPIGIAKGLLVIIDYHREHEDDNQAV